MAQDRDRDLPEIGFLFHYPDPKHPTDKFRLDVFISSEPTEKHFDVLKVHFPALASKGPVSDMKVFHPWPFEKQIRVCAGLVILEDRKGEKVEGFTFGGQMEIETRKRQTACTLVSKAPILHLSEASGSRKLFIEEIEILLAEQQAKFSSDLEYHTKLCRTDPLQLYLACLKEINRKLGEMPNRSGEYDALLDYTHQQEHRLARAGLLQDSRQTLEEVLQ